MKPSASSVSRPTPGLDAAPYRRVVATGVYSCGSLLQRWHLPRRVWVLDLDCGHRVERNVRDDRGVPRRARCPECAGQR